MTREELADRMIAPSSESLLVTLPAEISGVHPGSSDHWYALVEQDGTRNSDMYAGLDD